MTPPTLYPSATLLISCPDQQGLVAKIANFIYANGGNIIHADQHRDGASGLFLSRIEWSLAGFNLPRDLIGPAFNAIAQPLQADWRLCFSDAMPRLAIWVSHQNHCLLDLLWRHQAQFSNVVNIHHSFLPAFMGAQPYHRAHERGVKIIGATAHYVTEALDAGPIIEQDVVRITHRDDVKDLIRKGKDLERIVLSRGVRLHLQNRVLVYGNRTVVFSKYSTAAVRQLFQVLCPHATTNPSHRQGLVKSRRSLLAAGSPHWAKHLKLAQRGQKACVEISLLPNSRPRASR